MLRGSANGSGVEVDIQGINGNVDAAALGIEFGVSLMRFAEAIVSRETQSLKTSRNNLLDIAGPKVVVEAAAVAANFQRMVRIADSIGIPIDEISSEAGTKVREELDLAKFASARHTSDYYKDSLIK